MTSRLAISSCERRRRWVVGGVVGVVSGGGVLWGV